MELLDQFTRFPHVERRGSIGSIFRELFSKAPFDLLVLMQGLDLNDPFFVKDVEQGTVGEFLRAHGEVIGSGNPLLWKFSDEEAIYKFHDDTPVLGGVGNALIVKTLPGVDYSALGKEHFQTVERHGFFSVQDRKREVLEKWLAISEYLMTTLYDQAGWVVVAKTEAALDVFWKT